ncbi:MAG: Hint domain-containing protein [Pseudomonadota bacterium]
MVEALSINANPSQTLSGGAADGAVTTSTSGAGSQHSIQFDIDGNNVNGPLTPNDSIICFVRGTRIRTPDGDVPVETLSVGDMVLNVEGIAHPIRWIGSRRVSTDQLRSNPMLRPVRITAGALGPQSPVADLRVSRQHRLLVRSKIAERMFGTHEVLISAIKLTGLPGVFIEPSLEETEYFHILFDQHEIVIADGAAAESLLTGPLALATLSKEAQAEIQELLPEVFHTGWVPSASRYVPSDTQQRKLIDRHTKNRKSVVETGPGPSSW